MGTPAFATTSIGRFTENFLSSMPSFDLARVNARIEADGAFLDDLRAEVGRVIVGQRYLIDRLLIGLLCGGTSCWKACRVWPRR